MLLLYLALIAIEKKGYKVDDLRIRFFVESKTCMSFIMRTNVVNMI